MNGFGEMLILLNGTFVSPATYESKVYHNFQDNPSKFQNVFFNHFFPCPLKKSEKLIYIL